MKESSLIIGADSKLGSALKEYHTLNNKTVKESTRRKNSCSSDRIYLDLSGEISDVWEPPTGVSVAFLCAAVTSLDKCYNNPVESARINVDNTVKIARACIENDIFVIFPSTNLVFDGTVPFRDKNDTVSPRTEYGRQKARAEKELQSLGNDVAIARFTKIIDTHFPLITTWISLLRSNNTIHPFSDYVMAPVPLSLAVESLFNIAKERLPGIHQISGPRDISYADIASHLAQKLHFDPDLVCPGTIQQSGIFFEHNPAYTTLNTKETEKKLGVCIPDPIPAIERMFLS